MGTWNNDHISILRKLAEALDNIEGDFTDKSLQKALAKLSRYPYVCDIEKDEKSWRKLIDEM